jgi:23S rRNA-/tRNA-specific pseudouridylate synthase
VTWPSVRVMAEQEWIKAVNKKPKLRTYKTFKQDFLVSDYVKWSLNRYDRSLLAKFRCGILQLRIETGRFNQTKLEDRTCQICNTPIVEDEFHFLCICICYDDLRQTMFNNVSEKFPIFANMNVNERFLFLMSTCIEIHQKRMGEEKRCHV